MSQQRKHEVIFVETEPDFASCSRIQYGCFFGIEPKNIVKIHGFQLKVKKLNEIGWAMTSVAPHGIFNAHEKEPIVDYFETKLSSSSRPVTFENGDTHVVQFEFLPGPIVVDRPVWFTAYNRTSAQTAVYFKFDRDTENKATKQRFFETFSCNEFAITTLYFFSERLLYKSMARKFAGVVIYSRGKRLFESTCKGKYNDLTILLQ